MSYEAAPAKAAVRFWAAAHGDCKRQSSPGTTSAACGPVSALQEPYHTRVFSWSHTIQVHLKGSCTSFRVMGGSGVPNLTKELKNQKMADVFREFYRLEEVLDKTEWYVQGYAAVRLVAIIEQFFRGIVRTQLQNGRMAPPQDRIALLTGNLRTTAFVSPEVAIAASYDCQSVKDMNDIMNEADINTSHSHAKRQIATEKFADLFELRHNIVHSVSLPESEKPNLRDHHTKTEKLLQYVFTKVYDDSYFYFSKGDALAQLGRHQEVMACYDEMIRLNPGDAEAHYNKGILLAALDKHQEAIECYDEAIRLNPNHADAYYNKGKSLTDYNRHSEDIGCYDEAIRLDPNYTAAFYNKGILFVALGKREEAMECYDEAIRLNPNHADALNNKGTELKALGKYEEAMECYDEAIRLNPDFGVAYRNKANVLVALGRHEEAQKYFEIGSAKVR